MNFLDKMERKYGRYALSHLTMYIIVTYIAGYIIQLAAPIMRQYLTLEPYYILHGQIWRLVSWILIPLSSLDIFTIIMLFFYYSIGTSLERAWGDFKYNVYIFSGILIANRANIYSCRIVRKRIWRNDIIHPFVGFSHRSAVFKFFILRDKSMLVCYRIAF